MANYFIDAEDDFWKRDDDGSWWFHDGPWRPEGYSASSGYPKAGVPLAEGAVMHTDPGAQPLRRLRVEE